jgi:hypothetical protein
VGGRPIGAETNLPIMNQQIRISKSRGSQRYENIYNSLFLLYFFSRSMGELGRLFAHLG